ncbi:hypothetical protein TEA_010809 [Camellia sinensis var. sinensis]|uniref:Vesicle-fusing ATPase n=1 Tax=Camellia sinensis var. sinensis TaxID=542762 RepID=A0A4S4D1E1_CAMSN|nr:hypothetical protein TEA_010809 [Camellia sinensis var. sinensis]
MLNFIFGFDEDSQTDNTCKGFQRGPTQCAAECCPLTPQPQPRIRDAFRSFIMNAGGESGETVNLELHWSCVSSCQVSWNTLLSFTNVDEILHIGKRALVISADSWVLVVTNAKFIEEDESGRSILKEARIMNDVPVWKVGESVYNFGRWMPPATTELCPDVCGKTAMAATVGIDSDFPYVKIISAETMIGRSESSKCAQIVKVFEDAYKSPLSIIIVDDIERLPEYVAIGPWFSNLISQTLMTCRLGVRAEYARNLIEKGHFGGENSKQPPNHPWLFLYVFRPSDPPLLIFGRTFTERETLGILVLSTVLVIFLTSVGSVLISALMVGLAIICGHGALRVPEDLFLDEQEPVASATGFLSFLAGAGSNAGASATPAVAARG